jgi:hypothetical protein
MTVAKVIRYKTKPESADENERLIRDVFAELAKENPEGLRYAAFRLDGDDNPLSASAAFGQFQSGIKDRCAEGPVPADATVVGSYRILPGE